jgi:nucleotide-binding universal stress UspA family protein
MMAREALIVPLDASEQALSAVPVAKGLAQLQGGTLHFVHCGPESGLADVLGKLGLSAGEMRGSILDAHAGEPAAGILRVARDCRAALVVMSMQRGSPAGEKTLGSTALAVLEGASCPVVLVRPDRGITPWTLRRVLLPHDGTPTTSAAIPPAAKVAARAEAELEVLHVAAPGSRPPHEQGSLAPPLYVDQPQHEWPAWAGEFLERLGGACELGSLKVHMSLGTGAPGEEVVRSAAEHASDLIVLAWRGAWQGERAATIKAVLRGARCPVMIIRSKE